MVQFKDFQENAGEGAVTGGGGGRGGGVVFC